MITAFVVKQPVLLRCPKRYFLRALLAGYSLLLSSRACWDDDPAWLSVPINCSLGHRTRQILLKKNSAGRKGTYVILSTKMNYLE